MQTRISKIIAFTLILALGPMVANATTPTTGTPVLGPDGHYYEVVSHADVTWAHANSTASGLTYLGVTGHLATITSQGENDFLDSIRQPILLDQQDAHGNYIPSAKAEAWIGGSQPAGAHWEWVTGEAPNPIPPTGQSPFPNYANWQGGEPNDLGGEDQITLGRYVDGTWNDSKVGNGNIGGYIIEYDTVYPTANDDLGNTANSGETINIDVLANDILNDQDVTSVDITTPSSNGGTAVVVGTAPNFSVDYTSAPGFGQQDSFKYTVSSGGLESNQAIVTIDVDGSVSVTPSGDDIIIFGGPENGVPLLATGELAGNSAESSLNCGCKIRDPRVYKKTRRGVTKFKHRFKTFDIGAAISNPHLASPECADLPSPGPGKLKIPPAFSVHTDPAIAKEDLTLDDFAFGLCLVETGVQWSGVNHFDVNAQDAAGYEVDCKIPRGGVGKQPLTLGLTTFPEEYTAPFMRPVTIECDPRGAARWSTWYFTPNATHLPRILPSRPYVQARFLVLRGMLFAMGQEGAVEAAFLNSIKSIVRNAQRELIGFRPPTAAEIQASIDGLDQAALEVLGEPPVGFVFPGSGLFPNPKGELASHVLALRYAVCSELQNVNDLENCQVPGAINALLPPLPGMP